MTGLLALAALMVPVARYLSFPHTVLLAVVGVAVGLVAEVAGEMMLAPLHDFFQSLTNIEITADAVFFVFLPALVFEAALALDVRRLMDDIAPILFLAVLGLLISTVFVGASLFAVTEIGLVACLMLGAIVSATDPVAVVAIFKEVGAPKRLSMLVEGESLFNDASAIVAFTILAGMLTGTADPSVLSGITSFLKVFVGGVVVGFLIARIVVWIISRLHHLPLVEQSLTISLAYLSFIAAEHYLHVSGVMAVVTAALVMGSRGRTVIRPHHWHGLHETWEQIGFWANSLIFLLVGLAVPAIMKGFGATEFGWLVVLIVAAFAARALAIFGLVPLLSRLRLADEVSVAIKAVMFWGGLRGAVSLALALVVIESPQYPAEVRGFVGVLVTGFVLFTLFINAPTINLLIRIFGLDQLSNADAAVRDRALTLAHRHIGDEIEQIASRQEASVELIEELVGGYHGKAERAQEEMGLLGELGEDQWQVIGLSTLTARERYCYAQQFENGFLSSDIYRQLIRYIDDITDGLRMKQVSGYERMARAAIGFDWRFRLALGLHRRFGISKILARRLAERFEFLTSMKLALDDVAEHAVPRVAPLVGESVTDRLRRIVDRRREETATAANALALQYPKYARTLKRQYLKRAALRLEGQSYQRMFEDAVITTEVHRDLERHLAVEAQTLHAAPGLDLGLDPKRLVRKVPLFEDLTDDQIADIARLLKSRLVLPDEKVCARGETGDAMYFISSGSVRVMLSDRTLELGSGDFFGEIALLRQQPRNAEVVATCYCDLLTLYAADFKRLLEASPRAREAIERVAAQRLTPV